MKKDVKNIHIQIDRKLHTKLKEKLASNETTLRAWFEQLANEFVE